MPLRIRIAIVLMKRLEWWAKRLRVRVETWARRHHPDLLVVSRAGRVEEIQ